MTFKSSLILPAFLLLSSAAYSQVTLGTGIAGVSGVNTLNVIETNFNVFYRPGSGEGVVGGIENVTPEYRRAVFTGLTFSGGLLDVAGYNAISAQSVSQAGLGAWVDPRLASTFNNTVRWIAPTTTEIVSGSLSVDGNLIADYQGLGNLTTQTNRVGDYFYVARFTLSASDLGDMTIKWATDNRSDIYVNGALVASKSLPAVNPADTVIVPAFAFSVGINELVVAVRNENVGIQNGVQPGASENPTGLVLEAVIPEPSTYAMLAAVAALGFAMIRRRS
jgi:hypothetical protein